MVRKGNKRKFGSGAKSTIEKTIESIKSKARYNKKVNPELTSKMNDLLYALPKEIPSFEYLTEANPLKKELKRLEKIASAKSYKRTKANELMDRAEYERVQEFINELNRTKKAELRATNKEIIKHGGVPIPEKGYWIDTFQGKQVKTSDKVRFYQFESEVNPYDKEYASKQARREAIENIEKASKRQKGARARHFHSSYAKAVREQLQHEGLADYIENMTSASFSGLYYAKGGLEGDLAIGYIYDEINRSEKIKRIASLVGYQMGE